MTSKDLSIFNSLKPFSIGFDDMFDQFESMLGNGGLVQNNYPPYNIRKAGNEIIHRGISQRSFQRSFTIADDVKVNGAELKDGLLTINCEKIVPELKKKKLIPIN